MALGRVYCLLVLGLLIGASGYAFGMSNQGTSVSQCLPGDKKVCTLGPPPTCHCEPSKNAARGVNGATGVSGPKNSNTGKSRY